MDPTARLVRPRPVAVLAGVAVCAAGVAWLVAAHLGAPAAQRLVDLDVYRQAGRSVLDGRDVYAFLAHPPQRLPFTYPPFAALLAVPLAVLPFMTAAWLWTVGEVACTVAITGLAFRPLLARFGRWWPMALGAVAAAMQQLLPLRDEVKFGQVDELLVLLCAVDCLLLVRRRGAGVLVGLATAVKLTPGVFIVYLFVSGRRRAAGVAAAVFVAASGLSAAALPHDSSRFWTDALWHSERLRANDGTSNQSLRGMWLRAVHDGHASAVLWAVSAAVVAIVGFRIAAQVRRHRELDGVAVTGLLAVLLSPVAWIHHLCWLPLVLGGILADGRDRTRAAVAVVAFAFFLLPVPWWGSHATHGALPLPIARLVQDGFGLAALLLVLTAPMWSTPRQRSMAPAAEAGHNQRPTIREARP